MSRGSTSEAVTIRNKEMSRLQGQEPATERLNSVSVKNDKNNIELISLKYSETGFFNKLVCLILRDIYNCPLPHPFDGDPSSQNNLNRIYINHCLYHL